MERASRSWCSTTSKSTEDYRAVFWIEAGSKETIERDYIQIYSLLFDRSTGAGQETVKVKDAVPAVKRWFQGRKGRWLVVLDSADTVDNDQDKSYIDLQYFMPDAPRVHIIITSRSSAVQGITELEGVEVAGMEASEAIELFQRSAKSLSCCSVGEYVNSSTMSIVVDVVTRKPLRDRAKNKKKAP